MAQIKYSDVNQNYDASQQNARNSIGFFSLKNDGDEAIVRIMHDSTDSFDILTTHQITVNGKYRRINCIRDPHEPIDNCPICKKGAQVQQRFYIHLIEYVRNENGTVTAVPKVWERSMSYANKIKNLIDEYGPLSNCVFKIHRDGAAGSMTTNYSIMYANPAVYTADAYPIIADAFNGYTALGTIVLDKSFDDISYFIANESFPVRTVEQPQAQNNYQKPIEQPTYQQYQNQNTPINTNAAPQVQQQTTQQYSRPAPWENQQNVEQPVMQRPVRYYN